MHSCGDQIDEHFEGGLKQKEYEAQLNVN